MDETRPSPGAAAAKKAFSLLEEFKAFALKGNVIDLAVGVIIGAAFGKIVSSLVENIFMPLVGAALPGDQGYQNWSVTLNGSTVKIGVFLADVINFVIVAFALFLFVVKFLGWVRRLRKEEAVTPLPPTKDQELLMEIRDLLKGRQGS